MANRIRVNIFSARRTSTPKDGKYDGGTPKVDVLVFENWFREFRLVEKILTLTEGASGRGYDFAKLNKESEKIGLFVDDLHVSKGGNSFRKAGSVRPSKVGDRYSIP